MACLAYTTKNTKMRKPRRPRSFPVLKIRGNFLTPLCGFEKLSFKHCRKNAE